MRSFLINILPPDTTHILEDAAGICALFMLFVAGFYLLPA